MLKVIKMPNKNKIKLLHEIEEVIETYKGLDDMKLRKIGVTPDELLNPTKNTLKKLILFQKEEIKNNTGKKLR